MIIKAEAIIASSKDYLKYDQNDIEMLKLCGKGIAVANAVSEALEAADEVTLSNDEDGVVRWLAEHWQMEMDMNRGEGLTYGDRVSTER